MTVNYRFLLVDEILSRRILIISHSETQSEEICELLEMEGFSGFLVYKTLSDAVLFLSPEGSDQESSFLADIIIICIDKEMESPLETIWEAKETFESFEIPLVIIGDIEETEELIEIVESGCIDYFPGPLNPFHIVSRLKTLLRLQLSNKALRENQKQLNKITEELESKNRELNQLLENIKVDLQIAGELQRSYLPTGIERNEYFDFAWFYQPCETIGGDLLNVVRLNDRFLGVYLLDVAGHGVSAALLAFTIHRYLSATWGSNLVKKNNGRIRRPSEVLKLLNHEFYMDLECFKYFTITYGVFDLQKKIFNYCRAGQTPVLLLRKGQKPSSLIGGDPPVGISHRIEFHQFEIHLHSGDRFALYSDGLTEARKGKSSEEFGEKRMLDIMMKKSSPDIHAIVDEVVKEVYEWIGKGRMRDDISLLIFEVK